MFMEKVYINLKDKIADNQYISIESVNVKDNEIVIEYHINDTNIIKNQYDLKPNSIYKVILKDDEDNPIGDTWYMRFIEILSSGSILCKSCFSLNENREYIDYISLHQSRMCDIVEVVSITPATSEEIAAFEYIEQTYKGNPNHFIRVDESWKEIINKVCQIKY